MNSGPSLSAKMEAAKGKNGGGGGCDEAVAAVTPPLSNHSRLRSFGKPSWLLFTIADLDDRMKMLAANTSEDNTDSFAERAEAYYQKRPQLLALLQDLYNSYLSLADRHCHTLAKNNHHRRYSSPISPFNFNDNDQCDEEDSGHSIESDVESSLSYQNPFPPRMQTKLDADMIVVDLVMKSVDYEIILDELNMMEKRWGESSRKIELQKTLLDVLESERLILLNENASLEFRVNALLEENKGLATESVFMKRKVAELARCVLMRREDHRACTLSRKVEDLQGQIYGLEKKNKEYYDQLVKHEEEKKIKVVKSKSAVAVTLHDCFPVPENDTGVIKMKKGFLPTNDSTEGGGRGSKLWDRLKKFDIFLCVPHANSTCC